MRKKIKCDETGMVKDSNCKFEFKVENDVEFLVLAKNHYLTDEEFHKKESSANFFFTNKEQFDSEEGKTWAKQVFDNRGEEIIE